MKKQLLTLSMLLGGLTLAQAQVSNVNPVPHEVNITDAALFDVPAEWAVVADKGRAQSIALAALQEAGVLSAPKAKFTVRLGVRGDKAVKSVARQIPAHAEGYFLHIGRTGITVAGADEQGLFYGVQSLLAVMRDGKLQACDIQDFPDVSFRGVVEGFYGTPWSQEARLSQLSFYGRNKMNVYIYGPKDDPYHRDRWRVPYPADEAARLQQLVEHAHKCGVNFYWAIHPGVDIKWTTEDRDALMAKLEQMYALGVRSFAVFFDDIWGEGAKADKQAALLNYIDDNFVQKKHDVSPLVLCPTEYNRAWANDERGYLRTLGTQMNKSIHIMWTGNTVVHCIDREGLEWVNQRIDRKAYIWWNFPVSDFVRDHLLLGPTYGNDLDIAPELSGFVSNPMEHAEASKIALYSIADYTWNMQAYDAMSSWHRAIADLLPGNAAALSVFAALNEDPGPNGHGFRRAESRHLAALATRPTLSAADADTLQAEAHALGLAANTLLADQANPALVRELRPWLLQAKLVSEYGQAVCDMARTAGQPDASAPRGLGFSTMYAAARSLQKQMYDLENSDVRHPLQPGIKVAAGVLMPTLNRLFAQSVAAHNAAQGTQFDPVAEFQPFSIESTVPQLRGLAVTARGNNVSVAPSLEVVTWAPGAQFTVVADRAVTLQGFDCDFGAPATAPLFTLEVFDGTEWHPVSLLHYKEGETTIHTGNELAGMRAEKIRFTNTSGSEQQLYFKRFNFVKR